MSANQLKCINLSREAKLDLARTDLSELKAKKLGFENPLGDLRGGIKWADSTYQIAKQLILLPIAILLTILTYLSVPFLYILDAWDSFQTKREVKLDIKTLESEILQAQLPTNKVLAELWELHGMCSLKYSSDEIIRLLESWINILYGEEVCNKIQVHERIQEINQRQMKANLPYHQGKRDAAHFHFVAPVNVLISELSSELPEYE